VSVWSSTPNFFISPLRFTPTKITPIEPVIPVGCAISSSAAIAT
jgi:hypothetical protein